MLFRVPQVRVPLQRLQPLPAPEAPGSAPRWLAKLAALGCSIAGALVGLPAAAQIFGTPAPTATPSTYIVGRMGVEMAESNARHGIAFRPFTPPRRIITTALLPPFHGDDTRLNRGIAFEYADEGGRLYALAQWPANGGSIEAFAPLAGTDPACADARRFSRGTTQSGIVWSTPRGLIMTLQSDGTGGAQTVRAEWRKLIRRGACR